MFNPTLTITTETAAAEPVPAASAERRPDGTVIPIAVVDLHRGQLAATVHVGARLTLSWRGVRGAHHARVTATSAQSVLELCDVLEHGGRTGPLDGGPLAVMHLTGGQTLVMFAAGTRTVQGHTLLGLYQTVEAERRLICALADRLRAHAHHVTESSVQLQLTA